MIFSLRGDSIATDGSGRVLITDINPNGDNDEDALICTSETNTSDSDGRADWFLNPTQMSINEADRISPVRLMFITPLTFNSVSRLE